MDILEVLETTADAILCDVVDYVSQSRLAEYDRKLESVSKEERETIFKVLDVLLEKK